MTDRVVKLPVGGDDYEPQPKSRVAGITLRRVRVDRHLSFADVAEALGVHEITVRNWEREDTVKPMVGLAYKGAFGVDVWEGEGE